MTNNQIAEAFSLLSKLMEVHGENSFKSKSYANASFNIGKLNFELSDTEVEKINSVSGLGDSTTKKIIELLETGRMKILQELLEKTPDGILELLKIKGIGPKKIHTIWKEMEIENAGELLYACKENRLKLFKGFGEKTQNNIAEALEFFMDNKGSFLYSGIGLLAAEIQAILGSHFTAEKIHLTGDYKMRRPVINLLEYVIKEEPKTIEKALTEIPELIFAEASGELLIYKTKTHDFPIHIYAANEHDFIAKIIKTSSTPEFLQQLPSDYSTTLASDESSFFSKLAVPYIPAFLREKAWDDSGNMEEILENLVTEKSIKGLIHCHSKWSDGNNTIKEMAEEAIKLGLEYMVMTDHSKSAFYAEGLQPEKVVAQQNEIDALNIALAPFKIFKGIESDILNDGRLDYETEVLNSFDCIVASIHSNLKMDEEKAMQRLLRAIENPYTSILGHMTGRLLLSRQGYPVDHKKIIDSCAAHNVAIELNANPRRLDIDWTMIEYAMEKNILLSVNPDAHSLKGIGDIKFGVLVAQKGMLPASRNLSSYTLAEFEKFIEQQKEKRST